MLQNKIVTLLGTQVTVPGSVSRIQSITFRATEATAFPQAAPSMLWGLLC